MNFGQSAFIHQHPHAAKHTLGNDEGHSDQAKRPQPLRLTRAPNDNAKRNGQQPDQRGEQPMAMFDE